MKRLARREIGIGLSVIVAIIILIFGIEFLKGINLFRPANFYMAYYDNVDGLDISAPVKVNGYKVGQVREINFDYSKPGKTEVVLALNKDLHLPVDSKAIISSSLMGEAYIEINVGNSTSMIPVGGEVATKEVPGLLSGIADTLMPQIGQTLTYVDSLLMSLYSVTSDPALKVSMGKLEGISNNVLLASDGLNSLMNQQVPRLMGGAQGIVDSAQGIVNSAQGIVNTAGGTMTNINGIVNNFGHTMTRVDTISGNLATFSGQLTQLPLQQAVEGLNNTLANLEQFSAQLKNPDGTLGKLMNDPEFYNRLNSVAASVDSLIVDIKRNPKRYISIKLL